MTDARLGESDANGRWGGVRRHQAILVASALAVAGEGVVTKHWLLPSLAGATVLAGLAAPGPDGLTMAQWAGVSASFFIRRRTRVLRSETGDPTQWRGANDPAFALWRLQHRGRLDLSGADVHLAESLSVTLDAISQGPHGGHLSLHVTRAEDDRQTWLALPPTMTAPATFARATDSMGHGVMATDVAVLERWRYLRLAQSVVQVWRVLDVRTSATSRPLLERVLRAPLPIDCTVHFEVLDANHAKQRTARAAHAQESDGAVARKAGYRQSARAQARLRNVAVREVLVAEGAALVHVAIFFVVRAASREDLRAITPRVEGALAQSGLRAQHGAGRQGPFLDWQLPGARGW